MTERPIIFSGESVRAILGGRKSMTRRLCKRVYDTVGKDEPFAVCPAREFGWIAWYGERRSDISEFTKQAYEHGFQCPHGAVGDRLWLRETWARSDDNVIGIVYRADWEDYEDHIGIDGGRWRSPIFMPREFSRITLEITGVAVERLQDISEEDAKAEGLQHPEFRVAIADSRGYGDYAIVNSYRGAFANLWERINGKKHPWASNPWVWVVSFKTVNP